MKKAIALLLALMMTLCLFAGCGNDASTPADDGSTPADDTSTPADDTSAPDNSDITIGFIPMNLNNEFYVYMENGARKAAEELGVNITVQGSMSGSDVASQLEFIENMIASGVSAIVISPAGSDGLTTGLQKCQEAGIPVINVDSGFDKPIIEAAGLDPIPFLGSDDYAGTTLAGQWVAENVTDAKCGIITGLSGIPIAIDREEGFINGLGDAGEIVATQAGDWDLDTAYQVTQNMITAHPEMNVIFASSDQMAVGAIQAIEEAGRSGEITVLSYDGVSAGIENVKAGKQAVTVSQDPIAMGYDGVKMAYAAINGEENALDTRTGNEVLTKDTVADWEAYIAPYGE